MQSIIAYYTTKFGELWEKSLFDLVNESVIGVLNAAKLDKKQIDVIFFGNMLAGTLENNLHLNAKIAEILGVNIPIFRIESACASGGMAFHLAKQYLESNKAKTALIIGAEKMTDFSPEQVVSGLAAAASGEEQEVGLTFPGLYAMMANVYLQKNKYTEKNLAAISVKNHYHGVLNDKAHFQRRTTITAVLDSAYVATPLKVLDSSPISDGASALIISTDKQLINKSKSVKVLSTEVATDSISLKKRKYFDAIEATQIAASKAFKSAQLKPNNINVAELHDCFSIAEIIAMEDIGFWKRGSGGKQALTMSTQYGNDGDLIVNTSGGLKAAGHPVGATGVKQIGEIYLQLTGQAKNRQVKNCKYGLAQNVGGSGGSAVVTILGI